MNTTIFETDLTAAVEALRNEAGESWRVPAELLERTKDYYTRKAQQVRAHVEAAAEFWGLDKGTQNALLSDYARALFGVYDFTATREQMGRLRGLKSTRPFFIDKYGLYYAVIGGYWDVCKGIDEYDNITAAPELYKGVAEQWTEQRAYINGPTYTREGRAVSVLINRGEFDAGRFAAVAGPVEVSAFIDRCNLWAAVYDYATYYGICKYCLNATDAELKTIPVPREKFGDRTPQQFAEDASNEVAAKLQRLEFEFLTDIDETPTAKTAEPIKTVPADIVRVPDTFAAVLSRDVFGSINGKDVYNEKDILPIKSFIQGYFDKHPEIKEQYPNSTGITTPRMIERAIDGVNLLQRKTRVTPVNGLYTYTTNLTEFSELCGFDNTFEDNKRALLWALSVLSGLYLAVWSPRGISAVKVLNLRKIGLTGELRGEITIDVTTEAMKGKPQLLRFADFKRLRDEAKGYAENHFRYQIIGKGHKAEAALLDEIFGYTNAIREAEDQHATADEIKELRRNQQKHKPRDRKRLLAMFERQQAAGFLTFTRYQNGKGETVYKWTRTDTAAPQEQGKQEPDEQ